MKDSVKGYQLIEAKALNSLIAPPKHQVFAVAIQTWLCELLTIEFESHRNHVEFEVIWASYSGKYPVIGIYYKSEDCQNIGPLAEAAIDRFLREKSVVELAKFIGASQRNWNDISAEMLS